MRKRYLLGSYRLFFGLLALTAVIVQLAHQIPDGTAFTITNFFSFFTIESNLLAIGLFLVLGMASIRGKSTDNMIFFRGAVTLYMLITGIIYGLLLSGLQSHLQTTIPWVNTVVHYLMPVIVLGDWLIDLPRTPYGVSFKKGLLWLGFPFAYLTYGLIRGHVTNWYPYPFLNVDKHGYLEVGITCVIISLTAIGLIWILARLSRLRHI
jgi:hypothetical protein